MIRRVNRQIVLTRTTSKTSKSRGSKSELAEEDIEKIQEAFQLFDFDGKGKIDP
jgi:Ca2+-binding EF-hand superfamily protein